MKKFIYMLALGLIPLAGCESELDQTPFNALSVNQAFRTEADFINALRGAYTGLRGGSYYGGLDGGGMIITPDIMSDNLIINSQGRFSQQTTYQLNYTANAVWNPWDDAYTTILRANYILENIDKLTDGAAKENIKAEALALRALAHFDLLRVYGKRYIGSTDQDLGVPYVTSTDPTLEPARTPLKEAYNLVVADFLAAETGISNANGVGRLNKAAVQGLLGRVYLYMGQWQNAVDKSTAAISNIPAANALASRTEFPGIWTDATEKGVLFKLKILDTDAAVNVGVGYQQTVNGLVRAEYSPTCEIANQYQESDIRTNTYMGVSTYGGLTSRYVKKHVGRATGMLNVVDVKILRTAEVYLNRAEALYNLGVTNHAAALADLNQVRSRRYADFNPATSVLVGQELYDAILRERRLELAFEGHRFFDLKRLGLPIERSATQGDAVDCSGVPAPASARSLPANSFRFQLPIPQAEIDVNENIIQNTGYDN